MRDQVAVQSTAVSKVGSELWDYSFRYRPVIDRAIERSLPAAPRAIRTPLNEAVHRAIFPGGKRLRPLMSLIGAELFGGSAEQALTAAVAVEFLHTSSLIFDDFPGMDDASYRRGKLCLHKKYGEGMATLVALSYFNAAFGLVANSEALSTDQIVLAIAEIVECIGPAGMIGGQSVDLERAKSLHFGDGEMNRLKNRKTSALIRLALNLGAICCGAARSELEKLTEFAVVLGDAYQKKDDLLDLDTDVADQKNSFATHMEDRRAFLTRGLERDTAKAKRLLNDNFDASPSRDCLLQLLNYILKLDK